MTARWLWGHQLPCGWLITQQMAWIYRIWQIRGFLRCSAEDVRHLSLVLFTSWFIRLQTLSVFSDRLTVLQNSLACWRLETLIYLFSELYGCWLFLNACVVCCCTKEFSDLMFFLVVPSWLYQISLFSRRMPCLSAEKNGESGCFISLGWWSRKSL